MRHNIVIDVETFALPASQEYLKEQEKIIREELVQERAIQARLEKIKNNGALDLARAQIVAVAIASDESDRIASISSNDEEQIAHWLFITIEHLHAETNLDLRFVGFNIIGFDLPMLSVLMARYELPLPFPLSQRKDVLDLMQEPFGRAIGMKPLSWYLQAYGLEAKSASGSEVHEMWLADVASGSTNVEQYCRKDVELEMQLFKKMSMFYEF
jgi:hypothetical protein